MVRHTEADARTEFETHEDAFAAVHGGDVEAGDTVEVEYVDVNGERQTERGTVVDTDATPAGTVKGTEPRTWEVGSDIYGITYEVGGKNDHEVAGSTDQSEAPTLYTEVGGRSSDGGDRREMGKVVGVSVFPDDATEDTDDVEDAYKRFTYPSWYSVQNEGAESAPDGFPEAGLLEGTDEVRVGYLSNRTDNMVEVTVAVDEVVSTTGDDTYWFAGNPKGRDSDRYEVDFGTVTTRDSKGRLIKVGNVRYVDVPADRVRTDGGATDAEVRAAVESAEDDGLRADGGHPPDHHDEQQPKSSVDPTPSTCVWCGEDHPRESMRETHDGLRCPECYHDPDPEHADPDFDVEDIRHVVTDRDGVHLVTTKSLNVALCGSLAGGLRDFGEAADTVEDAARLGAWVNARDDMCDGCRDAFNDVVFDRD